MNSSSVSNVLNEPTKVVLSKGFVRVVDVMGDDFSIVQAARVSYDKGAKTLRRDAELIDYLIKNDHLSPLEMCEIKLHIKAPIFVVRQWLRHRTANVNERSARYSTVEDSYYIPSPATIRKQSKINKQGRSSNPLDEGLSEKIVDDIEANSRASYILYTSLLDEGVAREIARIVLPLNFYTEFYWKIDLRNLFHFLEVRNSRDAQFEMRNYAQAIEEIVEAWVPLAYKAFKPESGIEVGGG